MAAANVIVKCEEYLENEAHMGDINGCYNYQYLGQENQGGNDSDSGEDDQKMSELLREFDLEVLYAVLKCADITYRSLKYISENDINTAIRSIAYRAEFREKLFAWRRDKFGLNDISVLPSQRTNIVTPLGTNNDANIMTTEASSRQTSFCPSNPTSNKEATAKTARTRLPSTPKTCAAKIPRLSKETPASSGFTQLHQAQPQSFAPASPKACNAMVAASPMTTPTPCDTLSFMQSENTTNPVLDYDDPLCFQPTTSSAAAAAAVTSANAAPDTVSAQPQMNLEKLCYLKSSRKRSRGCTEFVWSKYKTAELIELYKSNNVLWNPANALYRDHIYKQKLLAEMSSKLDVGARDICAKIHNLRCQYNAALRKIKQLKRDAGTDYIAHTPRWEFFNALEFLSTTKTSATPKRSTHSESANDQNSSTDFSDAGDK